MHAFIHLKREREREREMEKKQVEKRGGGKEKEKEKSYKQWKSLVPVIYDWLTHHSLLWPSLSCRWGPQFKKGSFMNSQRLYISEQTDGSVPNTLVVANCDIIKHRVAPAEHIALFNEKSNSPFVKIFKTIIHPGEVNRIRELPQNGNIVATHTDSPYVLIWNVLSQPNRQAVYGAHKSHPDLALIGHKENAEFALAMGQTEPFVLSGGKDKLVVLWNIQDHISTLALETPSTGGRTVKNFTTLNPRDTYLGHQDTVEDVQFCPSSVQEFCSVGDDSCLIFWDVRTCSNPTIKVDKAHDGDIHCVDWNSHDLNLILTGSADNTVMIYDRRKLTYGLPVHVFEGHNADVLCVQWSPDKASVFGSSSEDGTLNLWDYEKMGGMQELGGSSDSSPGLLFNHCGHRGKVVDFHWSSFDPWTIVSVSDDGDSIGGGGTLQIWRIIDMIYRPREEVLAELENYKSDIINSN
ncbi:WD-40 repeat-containing protein MSI4-like [Impatiens glandulifera]|uniref:WD-40 repeat-containing protein MSI4-like n=1 Tax=Impatiens glandulifera TaxID=253017 RepID=UPI001FB15C7B|nr:WD-40 repeat-containing protein MSI4-like [Impatiens glandulifera]